MSGAAHRADELPAARGPSAFPLLEVPGWSERLGVNAGITGRGQDFTLGLFGHGPAASVMANWQAFRAHMRPAFGRFVMGLQCHGTSIAVHGGVGGGWTLLDDIDGHVTAEPGVLLMVTVADCVPCYLVHPTSGALGLIHAGWKGTAQGVLEQGISVLKRTLSVDPCELVMHCGVSICGSCYEVGPEVVRDVLGRDATGKERVDLRAELVRRARAAGVTNITASGWCTVHDADRFHSHRRDGEAAGRAIAYLGRPLAGAG